MSIVHRVGTIASLAVLSFAARPAAQDPAEAPLVYGRIDQAETQLRCFPTSYSPVYDELLAEGDVVVVTGRQQNGYSAVELPLGPIGFVHSRYAQVGEDGVVTSTGSNVAFRYRTNSREAPVRFVDDGTTFRLVATEGEWLKVRFPSQPVWITSTVLVTFPDDDDVATVEAAWQSHADRQQAQIDDAVAKVEAERAAVALLTEQREALSALSARFQAEAAKPGADQDIAPIRDDAARLVTAIAEGSQERQQGDRLLASIDRHAGVLEMQRVLDAEQPEPQVTVTPMVTEPDPLGEFATGWLKSTSLLGMRRKIVLEKGGQQLFEVECTTGRYNLDTFLGMEIAVRGGVVRPDPDSIRRLDVRRIEVLTRRK